MAVTKKTNVIIPEIMGPAIGARLDKALRLMPYAAIDNTLEGREGDEVTIPVWDYAGDAVEVAEGEEVPTSDLACTVRKYKVKKAMKAFPITDEAAESGFADPGAEAERQILKSLKGRIDQDLMDACYSGNVLTIEHEGALDYAAIVKAVAAFNYESNPDKVLFIHPLQEESLLLNPYFQDKSKFGEAVGIDGVIGKIAGCWVKKSKRIEYVEPTSTHGGYWRNVIVLIQNEKLEDEDPTAALTIYTKKGITLETQRDAMNQTEAIVGSKHYIATLTNSRKVVISKNIVAPALPSTLTYDGNGGTGTVEAQTAPGGTAVTLRANAFTREWYAFTKWNTKADGTGTDYDPGDSFTLTEDTTLYAVWAMSLPSAHPEDMIGDWNQESAGIGPLRSPTSLIGVSLRTQMSLSSDGTGVISISPNPLADVASANSLKTWLGRQDNTLPVAVAYKDNPSAYNTQEALDALVLEHKSDFGCVTEEHVYWGADTTTKKVVFARANGEFTVNGFSTNNNAYKLAFKLMVTVGSDIYFTYMYPSLTISYNANGGSGTMDPTWAAKTKSNTILDGTVRIRANTFTRDGYTFSGWNTAADGSGTSYADEADVSSTGDSTLYAQWAAETPSADPFAGKSFSAFDAGYGYTSIVFDNSGKFQLQESTNGAAWTAVSAQRTYTLSGGAATLPIDDTESYVVTIDGNGDLSIAATVEGETQTFTMERDETTKPMLPDPEATGE